MIWGGVDAIIIEIKSTVNIMHFNHPETISPLQWKNYIHWSWSLVAKKVGDHYRGLCSSHSWAQRPISRHIKALGRCEPMSHLSLYMTHLWFVQSPFYIKVIYSLSLIESSISRYLMGSEQFSEITCTAEWARFLLGPWGNKMRSSNFNIRDPSTLHVQTGPYMHTHACISLRIS